MDLTEKIEKYKQLRSQYEDILKKIERDLYVVQDKLNELQNQLKDEYGIENIEDANSIISDLEREIIEEEEKLREVIQKYNQSVSKNGELV